MSDDSGFGHGAARAGLRLALVVAVTVTAGVAALVWALSGVDPGEPEGFDLAPGELALWDGAVTADGTAWGVGWIGVDDHDHDHGDDDETSAETEVTAVVRWAEADDAWEVVHTTDAYVWDVATDGDAVVLVGERVGPWAARLTVDDGEVHVADIELPPVPAAADEVAGSLVGVDIADDGAVLAIGQAYGVVGTRVEAPVLLALRLDTTPPTWIELPVGDDARGGVSGVARVDDTWLIGGSTTPGWVLDDGGTVRALPPPPRLDADEVPAVDLVVLHGPVGDDVWQRASGGWRSHDLGSMGVGAITRTSHRLESGALVIGGSQTEAGVVRASLMVVWSDGETQALTVPDPVDREVVALGVDGDEVVVVLGDGPGVVGQGTVIRLDAPTR